jgi:complement component 1 Q subcomponent-binding protein
MERRVSILNNILVPESMVEFLVRVVKKGGKSGILIDGSTIDTSYEFNTLQFADDVTALYTDYVNQKPNDQYTGPAFNTLDERLQTEFNEFMSSLGVNEELMSFINVLSVDKDQRLYLKWLKNVNSFFSH